MSLIGYEGLRLRGPDEAGADRIDANPVRASLDREVGCKR